MIDVDVSRLLKINPDDCERVIVRKHIATNCSR